MEEYVEEIEGLSDGVVEVKSGIIGDNGRGVDGDGD